MFLVKPEIVWTRAGVIVGEGDCSRFTGKRGVDRGDTGSRGAGLAPSLRECRRRKGKLRRAGARAEFRAEVKRRLSPASQGQEYRSPRTVQIGHQWTRLSPLQGRGLGTKGHRREVPLLK